MSAGSDMVNATLDGLRRRRGLRAWLAILSLLALGAGAVGLAIVSSIAQRTTVTPLGPISTETARVAAGSVVGASLIVLLLCVLSWTPFRAVSRFAQQIHTLEEERARLHASLARENLAGVYDTVQLGLNRLEEFYVLSLRQARTSFTLSIILMGLGFLLLAWALWSASSEGEWYMSVVSGAGGLILEYVSLTAFRMHGRAMAKVAEFHERLAQTQDTMLAIRVTEDIWDPERKTDLRTHIALALLERADARGSAGEGGASALHEEAETSLLRERLRRLPVLGPREAPPPRPPAP